MNLTNFLIAIIYVFLFFGGLYALYTAIYRLRLSIKVKWRLAEELAKSPDFNRRYGDAISSYISNKGSAAAECTVRFELSRISQDLLAKLDSFEQVIVALQALDQFSLQGRLNYIKSLLDMAGKIRAEVNK